MWAFIRPILSRVLASWIAAIAIWLAAHYNVVLDETAQQQLAAGFLAMLFAIGQTVYAVVHRVADKKLNPGDAASNHLADKESTEAAVLKANDSH